MPQKCLVIITSKLHRISDINKAYHLGADSFLAKPVAEPELLETIKNFQEPWLFGK